MDPDMSNGNDDIDKWPFSKRKSKQKSPERDFNNAVPVVDGNPDSDDYTMKSPLGKCLIFNHRVFNTNLSERKESDIDAQRLYQQFRKLGFEEVRVFNDLTVREVMEKLKGAAKENSQNSCFICCILTHGDNGKLYARDGVYPINSLYEIFNGSACPTLRGKPKIFFIQACQGAKTESGVMVDFKESTDCRLNIPIFADFLIMLSTFPGFVSFKNASIGSYFIQTLCDVLEEHAGNKHLMDMLTIVTRRVAFYFESYNYKDASKDKKKQVPYITSTLTKNVKFCSQISS